MVLFVLMCLGSHILQYSPLTSFPTWLTKREPKIVTILCVHHFQRPFIILIFAERFQYYLEALLRLTKLSSTQNANQVDTPTKVDLSNKWEHTPAPLTTLKIHALPFPPPTWFTYNHTSPWHSKNSSPAKEFGQLNNNCMS